MIDLLQFGVIGPIVCTDCSLSFAIDFVHDWNRNRIVFCVCLVYVGCIHFQHVVNSVGRILDLRCREAWLRIQSTQPQALINLMNAVEKYTSVLAHNMPLTFTQPFDAVHDNVGKSQIVCWIFLYQVVWCASNFTHDGIHGVCGCVL